MKTFIKIFLFMFAATIPAFAQDDEEVLPAQNISVREKIQAARIAYITEQLALTPEEAEKFWPLYRTYTEKRKQLRRPYFEAKLKPDPQKTAEENDKALIELGMQIKQRELDLEKDYSVHFLKVLPAQKLKMLPEAEKRFRQMILEQVQRRHGRR